MAVATIAVAADDSSSEAGASPAVLRWANAYEGVPATNLDNTLLALVLTASYADGGYVVVDPAAGVDHLDFRDAPDIKYNLMHFPHQLDTNAAVALLVDRLFERNKMSGTRNAVQLSLGSSPTNGYVVDYDGNYRKYFRNDGGSWLQFYKENPKARGIVTVSLPAYDEKTGLVLVLDPMDPTVAETTGAVRTR